MELDCHKLHCVPQNKVWVCERLAVGQWTLVKQITLLSKSWPFLHYKFWEKSWPFLLLLEAVNFALIFMKTASKWTGDRNVLTNMIHDFLYPSQNDPISSSLFYLFKIITLNDFEKIFRCAIIYQATHFSRC